MNTKPALITLCLIFLTIIPVKCSAFQDDAIGDEKLRTVVKQLNELMGKTNLEAASKFMTKAAVEKLCGESILMAMELIEEDFEPEITSRLEKVFKDNELQDLKLPEAFTKPEMEYPSEKEFEKVMDKLVKSVPEPKRIPLATEIFKATQDFTMGNNPFEGEVTSCEILDDHACIGVEIAMELEGEEEAEGAIESAPELEGFAIFSDFVRTNNGWRWNGINEEKTQASVEKAFLAMESLPLIEDFSLSGMNPKGDQVDLEDYRGKVVLVDFWGTWCGPCVDSLPGLIEIHRSLQKHGFEIIGVAADDAETIKAFQVGDQPLPWKNIVDEEYEISESYGIEAFPTTLLINKEGEHMASNLEKAELIDSVIKELELDDEKAAKVRKELAKLMKGK